MTGLDLVAFRHRLAHHIDGANKLAQFQKAHLRLLERGFGDLRSVVGFCQRADLVGGAVDLLAKRHLTELKDHGEPIGQRFDFCLKAGITKLTEQSLEVLSDDTFGQAVIVEGRELYIF